MDLYRPNGNRVHCGEVLYVRINGSWTWARYEKTGRGEGYVIVDNKNAYSLDKVGAIDFERR